MTRVAITVQAMIETYDDAGRLVEARPMQLVTLAALQSSALIEAWRTAGDAIAGAAWPADDTRPAQITTDQET